jgi:hypothetical protein
MKPQNVTQTSYVLTNQPGEMARSTGTLAKAGINIHGLYAEEAAGQTIVNVVTDSEKTKETLENNEFIVFGEKSILRAFIGTGIGTISELCKRLAKENINIDSIFGAACPNGDESQVFLEVSDVERAIEILS